MKLLFKIFIITFFVGQTFGQKNGTHTVQKGETLLGLANKYSVKADDFIKANPSLKDGLKADAVLNLPANAKKITKTDVKSENKKTYFQIQYKVKSGDTMLGLANKFETTTTELIKNNPELKNGLKADQTINVYAEKKTVLNTPQTEIRKPAIPNTYLIQPKDTKYGVATKFGLSVADLEKLNPEIGNEFEIGTEIRLIKGTKIKMPEIRVVTVEPPVTRGHIVKEGETLFSISQKYNVEIQDLYDVNANLKIDGLKLGATIDVPVISQKIVKQDSVYPTKKRVNLLETVNKSKIRNLVLLLPFNINKIENDATKTKSEYLKSDKFLNITLDFYQGALIAIDSAKTLGLPIKVRVFDVDSGKNNSNVATIISDNDFSNVDAVLGPFGNNFVETAGQLLESKNIPVISPLSSETTNGGKNVFYSVPSKEIQRNNLVAFLEKNGANVLAIIQSNKSSSKEKIASLSDKIKFVNLTDKGVVDVASLTSNLKKGVKNYIILDADKTTLILNVISSLNKLKKDYDLQLVVLERNDAIQDDEVSSKSLANLKMIFPSALKENESAAAQVFANKFKKENKVFPNQYATRGFDVTFDTILRMCQEDGFIKSTETMVSEQIESQFYYNSKNANIGLYFMQYNPDLSIKEAK